MDTAEIIDRFLFIVGKNLYPAQIDIYKLHFLVEFVKYQIISHSVQYKRITTTGTTFLTFGYIPTLMFYRHGKLFKNIQREIISSFLGTTLCSSHSTLSCRDSCECLQNITTFSRTVLSHVSLAILLSLLDIFSGPQQLEDMFSILREKYFDSKLFCKTVQDHNSCWAIPCSIFQNMSECWHTQFHLNVYIIHFNISVYFWLLATTSLYFWCNKKRFQMIYSTWQHNFILLVLSWSMWSKNSRRASWYFYTTFCL